MIGTVEGGNYQALINQALREYIMQQPLEEILWRVVREELKAINKAIC